MLQNIKISINQEIFDERGNLSIHEEIPFIVQRLFWVNAKKGIARGQHAHKTCEQYFFCVKGKFEVILSDNMTEKEVILNEGEGVYIPSRIWDSYIAEEDGSIGLVLCSEKYDSEDYIYNKKLL